MDTIAKLRDTELHKVSAPTAIAMHAALEKKRSSILEVPRKTFKYGPTDRHKLDVYYPCRRDHFIDTAPILIFIYGGGFDSGERAFPAPFDLAYACVGSYFARQGFLTVIPDYRLAPRARFPDCAEDVRDAVDWVVHNPNRLTIPGSSIPDMNSLFIMGHSAGAVHLSTMLLLPEILSRTTWCSRISGIILNGGAYHFHEKECGYPGTHAVVQYWGGWEEARMNVPYALLCRAPLPIIGSLPKILIVEAEREPSWVLVAGKDFLSKLEERSMRRIPKVTARGHNHVSSNWTLGTGQGEEWAEKVGEWMKLNRPAPQPLVCRL
ncbi:alpha/beta hydrolase domain-containing protein [Crucibulum laeve]|uniref:Alpha/beta hydrolase domain-containing protein n=1 Tax=Crucibulum laeve TaxID=68775 RepID=A0A5C3M129_9AGAR|nr:alpha/beta hydrolase domain-containing protein [Crucibulum laeve]